LSSADLKTWRIKYYKGLGTSTSQEAREYFKRLDLHRKSLVWDNAASNNLNIAFQPDKASERKDWIASQYSPDRIADRSSSSISISDFINNDLVQFSHANLWRAIPSLIDGLKPSQRKVLYACFKRDRGAAKMAEVKVAQLAAYCSEHTSYHHGEVSLAGTIVKMAQDYVGSNNIPLLEPIGQFGTRLQGGTDCASARYIFTRLQPITRLIFPEVVCAHTHTHTHTHTSKRVLTQV
jgi:DNA topoisomerase II